MTETGSHPAVFAGLLGGAAWSVPTLALAVPADGVVEAVKGSLLLQFTLGCAIGAGLAGAIIFVQDRLDARKASVVDEEEEEVDLEAEEEPSDDLWSESSLNLVRAQVEEIDDDPTGDLGRFRTGQITIDLPVLDEEAAAAAATAEPRRPRHAKHAAAAPSTVRATETKRPGRHFAQAEQQESLVAALVSSVSVPEPSRGRHFAANVVVTPLSAPAPVVVEDVDPEASQTTGKLFKLEELSKANDDQAAQLRRRELLVNLPSFDTHEVVESKTPAAAVEEPAAPVAEKVSNVAKTSGGARHFATNTKAARGKAKSSKSERKGITGRIMVRMAERTRSVREVLADRLSDDAMNGIPVIERADGSVSDVAPTWFDHSFIPAIASLTGITGKLDDTVEQTASDLNKPVVAKVKTDDEPSRSAYISRHVAEVNVGMFPERRSADELDNVDAWEEALAAMGETIARETPVFQDVVGGPATIDDPDGLEGPTGFIPFRVPAAHPEVVDTETYVDYLLRDELSQNSAEVVRNSVHAHLRVIEGGTSPRLVRRRPTDTGKLGTGKVNTGRHFAQQSLAAQA